MCIRDRSYTGTVIQHIDINSLHTKNPIPVSYTHLDVYKRQANNHCLDSGVEGIESTINAINFNNMKHFGTKKQPADLSLIHI